MSKIPDLLSVKNALEHNVDEAMFCVTMQPTSNDMAVITPDQLMMSCGTKDLDHLNIKELKIHDCHVTGDPLGAAGIVFHGKEPIATAQRATHIDATGSSLAEQQADCVYVVATAAGLNHPVSLKVGPSEAELGISQAEKTRLGVARAARWEGLHHSEVDKIHDIETFEKAGETRRLFPLEPGSTGSPMAKLWKYNENNREFMGGRYLKQNRTEVGTGMVVREEDFKAGQELLKANLTPKSNFAETGLIIRAVPVVGQEHTTGQVHVRFSAIRVPITLEEMQAGGKAATSAAAHEGVLTLSDAQLALGEKPADVQKCLAEKDGVSATHADVFNAKLK